MDELGADEHETLRREAVDRRDGQRGVARARAGLERLGVSRGDRVVVKTAEGEVMAKQLARRGAKKVELLSLNAAHNERTLPVEGISFIHRIIWASQ